MSNYPSDLPSEPVTSPGPDAELRAYTPDEYLAAQALFVVRYMLHRMSYYTRPHGDNTYVYDMRERVTDYGYRMVAHAQCFARVAGCADAPEEVCGPAMDAARGATRLAFQWAFHVDLIARVAEQVVRIEKGESAPRSLFGELPLAYFGLTKFWWKQNVTAGCILFAEREKGLAERRAWVERATTDVVRVDGSCDLSEETSQKPRLPERTGAQTSAASVAGYPVLHTSAPSEDFED